MSSRVVGYGFLLILASTSAVAEDSERLRARIASLEERVAELERHHQDMRALLERLVERDGVASAVDVGFAHGDPRSVLAAATAAPVHQGGHAQKPPAPSEPAAPTTPAATTWDFYGMVRVDAIYDDSRPDSFQTPLLIRPEDPSTGLDNDSNFAFHPRLTRFGVDYRGPRLDGLGGAKLSGKFELDFQNGGRESRAIPRYRHAWLKLAWEGNSLLVGQSWDLISPLYPAVNADTLMWNAGNLGDRRVQARYDYRAQGGFRFAAALGLSGAVDPQDLDNDGVRDGEAASLPQVQLRLGYDGERAKLGAWSHYARQKTLLPVAGKQRFDSNSFGVDFDFALGRHASLRGEAWLGTNLADFRGGIGQGVNRVTGEEISSRGGWIELVLPVSDGYKLSAGYTVDDPDEDDLVPGSPRQNGAIYLVNSIELSRPLKLGIDLLRWRTLYQGLDGGTDNRFNLYLIYDF